MLNFNSKILLLGVALFLYLLCSIALSSERRDSLLITPIDFDQTGILKLQLRFDLNEERKLYNWKGNIYPLLNYGLFCNAVPVGNSEKIDVTRVDKILPVVPHPLDVKAAKNFEYPNPLLLKIRDREGEPYIGCIEFSLTYNTNGLKEYSDYLSILKITSNTVAVCNTK